MSQAAGNFHLVNSLRSALHKGEHGLSTVPGLLKRVLEEDSWREFVTKRGERVQHERFAEFVTTPPLAGLGADIDLIRRVVANDPVAVDLLDNALQNPVGNPTFGKDDAGPIDDNVHNRERPSGNSESRALRKLRKDAPELHEEVLAGRLSAHGAMVRAGFRKKTFTVPAEDPERVANTLRRQLDPETLAAVAALLQERR